MRTKKEVRKKTILLVEDEEIILSILKDRLEDAGYHVLVARDGAAGLQLGQKSSPDLILLDMLLPKMKGFEVLEKLHQDGLIPQIPTIIISNSGQPIEIERALKLGVRDYLIKVNFDPNDVIAKVDAFLQSGALAPPPKAFVPQRAKSRASVLIIEDELVLADFMEEGLAGAGFQTYKAIDASKSRAILAENHIDLILLDIILPDENGFVFLRELKKDSRYQEIPVIIISNLGQKSEIGEGMAAGAIDYIIKANVVPNDIIKKVEDIMIKQK